MVKDNAKIITLVSLISLAPVSAGTELSLYLNGGFGGTDKINERILEINDNQFSGLGYGGGLGIRIPMKNDFGFNIDMGFKNYSKIPTYLTAGDGSRITTGDIKMNSLMFNLGLDKMFGGDKFQLGPYLLAGMRMNNSVQTTGGVEYKNRELEFGVIPGLRAQIGRSLGIDLGYDPLNKDLGLKVKYRTDFKRGK